MTDRERHIPYDIISMLNLKKKDKNDHIYKTEVDSQIEKTTLSLLKGMGDKLGVC